MARYGSLILLTLLAGLGVWLQTTPLPWPEHELQKSLGHAFIIAWILGLTIDLYAKKRLVKEMSEDIFKFSFGIGFPDELKDKFGEVLDVNLIRREWLFIYTIEPIPDNPDQITFTTYYEFTMQNPRKNSKAYKQTLVVESHTGPRILEMKCISDDGDASYHLTEEQIAERLAGQAGATKAPYVEVAAKEVRIKHGENNRYTFRAKYSQTLAANGADYFSFDEPAMPVINVTIRAECPPGFIFIAPGTPVGGHEWRREKVFLSGEQVAVSWHKQLENAPPKPGGKSAG